ncbi:hypothetical protein ACIOD1_13010 [Streptomyces sp. NPDC088097]|uniref:hypothetical protein n=1 Tax=Streptomyces sp. NPDC088097 TaxID=3365823 RepID=UPI0037F13A7E
MDSGTPSVEEQEAAPPPAPPARYRVSAPGPVTGGVMGVAFANGQALIEDATQHEGALVWFQAEPGYHVQPVDLPDSSPEPAAEPEDAPSPVEAPVEGEPSEDSASAAPVRRRK